MVNQTKAKLLLSAIQNLVQLYGAEVSEKLKYKTSNEGQKNNTVTVHVYTFRFN